MNQCEMIVDYINEHGSITAREARTHLGIERLASRIHDLKEAGYSIVCESVSVKNRYGEKRRIGRYRFKGAEE